MAELLSLRDQPGTQREYETIFILAPESDGPQIQTINDRLRKIIETANGQLMRVENWGKRKLAYEISKHNRGIYLYWRYLSEPQLVAELERNLRMLDPVIRYMTVKVDEDVDPNARPSDVDDETFAAAATTIPDEEDIALGRDRGPGDRDEQRADGAEGDEAEGDKVEGDKVEAAAAEAPATSESATAEAPATSESATAEAPATSESATAETPTDADETKKEND